MSQSVFITGVSSGIGNALAYEYLKRGDSVFGVSRRTPEELTEHGNFHFAAIDLSDEEIVAERLPELLNNVRQLDLVVLNAGILGEIADMRQTSLADLRRLMDVNVWSCKTVIDLLFGKCPIIKRVITMSSGAAVNGNRGWNGYSISKAALNMLTSLYAAENVGTHFAAVAPGLVDTAMQDYLCGQSFDDQFPSIDALQAKRGTAEMPTPGVAAKKLVALFENIRQHVPSGGFIDIRHLPEFNQM